MSKLVLFGLGDIAQLAHYYFTHDSEHEVVAFTVDEAFCDRTEFEGLPVVPFEQLTKLYPPSEVQLFIAMSYAGMNRIRRDKYLAAKEKGYTLASYVSSRCSYMSQFPPGDNAFILEDNTIQPFVRIGDNVTLWSGNHIGHHSTVHSHNFISSHVVVSGHCSIGSYSFLGVNATLHHWVNIAEGTLVAAGALISRDTKPDEVYLAERSKVHVKKSYDIKL